MTLDSKPFVAVSAKNKSAASKLLQLSIPDLSPEPVRREFASLDKDRDKDRDSIHSRNSDTSSLCDSDADSLPPPLPFSAPPPLPCSPPPFQAPGGVFSAPEEVIEVRRAGPRLQAAPPRISPQRTPGSKMSDGVALQCGASLPGPLTVDPLPDHALDDQKSTTDLRAEFFSLGSPSNSMTKEGFDLIVLETAKVTQNPTDQASDSDLSSDENVREGTFSLAGDSGVVVSSLPTSPDDTGSNNNEGDNKIELISYSYTASANLTNTTITAIKEERDASATPTNTNSTLTSTKDGCDASATSTTTNTTVTSVKDNRNDVVSDQDSDVITTEFRVSATTGSAPTIQRPPSLSVADPSPPVAQTSPSSPKELAQADAAEVSAMTPRSREIFEKARHFAEMVQKPSFTVKREKAPTAEAAEADFSQEVLQGLEMERRAVISQSTVRRKDVKESLPSPASPTPGSGSAASYAVFTPSPVATAVGSCGDGRIEPEVCEAPPGRQTSQNHFDAPSPERSVSPQAKWSDNTGRLNLYSENVVQEPDSTEVVDRESIANLATTRRQWERIVTVETPQEPAPKKNPSKWQVRVPYAEKAASSPVIVTTDNSAEVASLAPDKSPALNAAAMESNIEREIRLTVEREEMLKREQEERVHSRNKVPSMESSTESELLQPTFHELTEADRGSEFLMNESRVQHEDSMQEESLQKAFHHQKFHTSSKSPDDGTTEGIIDREIRLQREREVELARQRGEIPIHKSTQVQHQVPLQPDPSPHPVKQHAAEPVVEDISYEEALTRHNHEGESRIAQELRELKEREEEMKRLRERMSKAYLGGGDGAERNKSQPASPALAKQQELSSQSQSPLKVAAAPQAPHTVDKTATVSHSVSRNVHASPGLDPTSDASSTPAAQPKNETPMQCEIRLSRERENEFRRSKGLPELPPTESERQENGNVSNNEDAVDSDSHGSGYHRYNSLQPDIGVRHFASNRLQREILEQKQREIKLRQEGHIITTSEEHIQPMRYAEVVGQDHSDTPSRRNFKPPVRRGSATPEEAAMDSSSHAISRDSPGVKKTSGGSASFKYKEFAQTAESRIERELREMREREEELRKQRVSGSAES